MDAAAMSTRRAGRTKVIQASLRCREDTHSLVPPRHTRGNLTEKRYFSHVTFRFVIRARTAPDPFREAGLTGRGRFSRPEVSRMRQREDHARVATRSPCL